MIKMKFDSQKDLNAVKMTLGNISFANDTGVILYFDETTIKAYPASSSKIQVANICINIKDIATEYSIDEAQSVGIIDIASFLQCFDAFGEGVEIDFDGEKFTMSDSTGTSKLKYYASMPDNITDCSGIDFNSKFGEPITKFTLDVEQIQRVLIAFTVLGQEFINVIGKAGDHEVTLSITNKGDRSNSFEFKLPTDIEVSTDINYLYSKDHLLAYFGYSRYNSKPDFDFSIMGPMLGCSINTDEFGVSYYVARKS